MTLLNPKIIQFPERQPEIATTTLRQALHSFLERYENEGTRTAYYYVLLPMVEALGLHRLLTDITPLQVENYVSTLSKKDYAAATVLKHLKCIKSFFNWTVKLELLTRNPAQNVKKKRLPTYVNRDKAMTDAELAAVLDYAKWKPRDHALILFLADTGCRAGGVAHLKVQDLDLEHCRATVTEKGNKTRQVAYGKECAKALRLWLKKRPTKFGDEVFVLRKGHLNSYAVAQILRRVCLKVGVRSLGSHSLRHRKAHQMADAKVAPSVAATALGHSSPTITLQNYYPADWESAELALKSLAENGGSDD